jgi:RNA polymerase sigma-70 factor (ECF subfamily)
MRRLSVLVSAERGTAQGGRGVAGALWVDERGCVTRPARSATAAPDKPDRAVQLRVVEALPDQLTEAQIEAAGVDPDRQISGHDFPSLYVRNRSAVATQARRFLSDPHDVEDVVQETFLRLFLAAPEIDSELQALAFSRRVVTNLCIDRYRADQRRPRLIDLDLAACEGLAASDPDQADRIVGAEDAAIVRQALALLTPLHRAALVKREIEEKPLNVIATELDVPEDSVKHLLFRARRALRRLLAGTSAEPGCDIDPDSEKSLLSLAGSRLAQASGQGLAIAVAAVMTIGGLLAFLGTSWGGTSTTVSHDAGPSLLGGQQFIRVVPPAVKHRSHHRATTHAPARAGSKESAGSHPGATTPSAPPASAPPATHHSPPAPHHHGPALHTPGTAPHRHPAPIASPASSGTITYGHSSVPATVVSQPRRNIGTSRTITTSDLTAPVATGTFALHQSLITDGSALPRLRVSVNLPGTGFSAPVGAVDTSLVWDEDSETYVVNASALLSGTHPGILRVHARYDAGLNAPISEQVAVTPITTSTNSSSTTDGGTGSDGDAGSGSSGDASTEGNPSGSNPGSD